jgi:aminopeptidase-like protein
MVISELNMATHRKDIGVEAYQLVEELYPICRSITGNGVRRTLDIINQNIPLKVTEVPSGQAAFDWTVPKEWNIEDAWIKTKSGEKIVDFQNSNLHVLNYSGPVHKIVTLEELKRHLFTLPDYPDWIPYRTSYYNENWGFCIPHRLYERMADDHYEILIDSTLTEGHLTFGEYYIQGETSEEVLISCHICHPSLCNDNLAGIAMATLLARHFSRRKMRYSYRFLFIPGTIGSITWLSLNETQARYIKHGLVVACVGDAGHFHYKKSRQEGAEIDRMVENVLRHSGYKYQLIDFFPFGYDERQYCSPGFNLPVGCLMRTPHGEYPEYHTSADNLDLVKPQYIQESFNIYLSIIQCLEKNEVYINQLPKCEPQLGKRGLYNTIGGQYDGKSMQMATLWVLNLSDGYHSLLNVSEKSGMDFKLISHVADNLKSKGLLKAKEG